MVLGIDKFFKRTVEAIEHAGDAVKHVGKGLGKFADLDFEGGWNSIYKDALQGSVESAITDNVIAGFDAMTLGQFSNYLGEESEEFLEEYGLEIAVAIATGGAIASGTGGAAGTGATAGRGIASIGAPTVTAGGAGTAGAAGSGSATAASSAGAGGSSWFASSLPWIAGSGNALSGLLDAYQREENAEAQAEQYDEQAEIERINAQREHRYILEAESLMQDQEIAEASGTGYFEGAESFAEGTAFHTGQQLSMNAAKERARQVLEEGKRTSRAYERLAGQTRKAGEVGAMDYLKAGIDFGVGYASAASTQNRISSVPSGGGGVDPSGLPPGTVMDTRGGGRLA